MTDLLLHANEVGAVVAFVVGALLMFAFWRATRWATGSTRHFAAAVFWITGSYIWRSAYWDIAPSLVEPDVWLWWFNLTGGKTVNAWWNLTLAWGAYHGLLGLHLTIPDADRARWPWWRAWGYPPFNPFRELATVIGCNIRRAKRGSR